MRNESATVYLGDVEIVLRGEYIRAEADTGPSYASGGTPGHDSDFDVSEVLIGGNDAESLWYALKDSTRGVLIAEATRQIEASL